MRSGSVTPAASISVARASVSAGWSSTSDDDINASVALHHFVALEPQLRIRRALPGLQFVFPAVPGADDVRFVVVIGLAEELPVLVVKVEHLAPNNALAGRSALMQTLIAVGVEETLI